MANSPASRNLWQRVAAAAVLAPVAFIVAYVGGFFFLIFWGLGAAAVLWEWTKLVRGAGFVWVLAGALYAAVLLAAPVLLRADVQLGFAAIVLLFAVVWTTDIAGYFAGRAIGGPKLAVSISPNKTWSGAIAGTIGAVVAAAIVAKVFNIPIVPIAVLAVVLSICSQAGDLFESSLKRRFNTKDTSTLIPGHGGVMDRLDGFWAAALIAAVIGVVRGGFDAPARGLLLW